MCTGCGGSTTEGYSYQCIAVKKDIGPELGFYENEGRRLNLEALTLDQVYSGVTTHAITACLWFSEGGVPGQGRGGWQDMGWTELGDIWPKSTSCPSARVITFEYKKKL